VAFVAFLAGALVMGLAFGAYALGDRSARDSGEGASAGGGSTAPAPALNVREVLDKAQPSVVSITTGSIDSIFGGAGSGVVISEDGLIITNSHVVASTGGRISVRFHDGTEASAVLVGSSVADDIALLRADRTGLTPAVLGSSANLRVGDPVVAIGNALALGGDPSVTSGIVSAKNRSIDDGTISLDNLIQTDAAINPGNSGGPLVNAAGEVVGINTAIIDGAQSVGFSLAIDQVKALLDDLEAGHSDLNPDAAVLGVASVTVDASLGEAVREEYGVTSTSGALVTQVDADSAASDAGLLEGDVIVEIDGQAIRSSEQLGGIIRSHDKGDRVSIAVERDGRRRTFDVTLGPN
jgi:putative serine protease PepD